MNMNYKEIKTQEEFDKARAEYLEKNPGLHNAKPVECLNLLLRKQFAQQILKGEKKVEFRAYSQHYCERLIDKDVDNWMQDHVDDEEAMFFANNVRPVKRIHFHNYNNSWSLDVECERNDFVALIDKDVEYLNEAYDCHELDEQLKDFNARKDQNRPLYFYFAIGKVIDSVGL